MNIKYFGVFVSLIFTAHSYADLPISAKQHLAADKEIREDCNAKHSLPIKSIKCWSDKLAEIKKNGDVRGTRQYFSKYYKPAPDEQLIAWLEELEINEVDGLLPAHIYNNEIVWITQELHSRKAYPGAKYEYGMIYMPVKK